MSITKSLIASQLALQAASEDQSFIAALERMAVLFADRLQAGSTIFVFGNGGSAAQASHFVGEMVGSFRGTSSAQRVFALSDWAVGSAIANDSGYGFVFRGQLQALAKAGDVAFGLTTSGKSLNTLYALLTRDILVKAVALTGSAGLAYSTWENASPVYIEAKAPSQDTQRIQEIHQAALHALAERTLELLL